MVKPVIKNQKHILKKTIYFKIKIKNYNNI